MPKFSGHEGQRSVIVRGSMHHAIMTMTEFEDWLIYEACTNRPWNAIDNNTAMCNVIRNDQSVRCVAICISADLFEV